MSLPFPSQNLSRFSTSTRRLNFSSFTNTTSFSLPIPSPSIAFPILHTPNISTSRRSHSQYGIGVFESEDVAPPTDDGAGGFNLESVLLFSELISLFSSAVFLVAFAVNFVGSSSKKAIWGLVGDRGLVWGFPLLVATVVLNTWIRRRQWSRMCGETVAGSLKGNLLDRIEKLEKDLRSSTTVIQALSRKLEKLGLRFRVTRKTLKDPIAETAALAQRNSEDTRALVVQEDMLEKELLEMQKVLLAMQEQQHKQLQLIIAIREKGKLMESKKALDQDQERTRVIERRDFVNEDSKELGAHEI